VYWRRPGEGTGTDDALVWAEADLACFVDVAASKSGRYAFLQSHSKTTSQVHTQRDRQPCTRIEREGREKRRETRLIVRTYAGVWAGMAVG
jgi:protease II